MNEFVKTMGRTHRLMRGWICPTGLRCECEDASAAAYIQPVQIIV